MEQDAIARKACSNTSERVSLPSMDNIPNPTFHVSHFSNMISPRLTRRALAAILRTSTSLPLTLKPLLLDSEDTVLATLHVDRLQLSPCISLDFAHGICVSSTTASRVQWIRIHVEHGWIIGGDPIVDVVVCIWSQLVFASAHAVCIVTARTLDPDIDVVCRAAGTESIELQGWNISVLYTSKGVWRELRSRIFASMSCKQFDKAGSCHQVELQSTKGSQRSHHHLLRCHDHCSHRPFGRCSNLYRHSCPGRCQRSAGHTSIYPGS